MFLTAALFAAPPARACDIPVFRYALERWPAEPFEIIVFHRGPLTHDQQQLADDLAGRGERATSPSNFVVRIIDLNEPEVAGDQFKLWERQAGATLPWIVVRPPEMEEKAADVWSGPLTRENILLITQSPARMELARRLMAGQSGVWLFVDGGDRQRDDAAYAMLEKELKDLNAELTLPKPIEGRDDPYTGPRLSPRLPLNVNFSALRISPTDAREQFFVQTLLQIEDGLKDQHEPLVFPVFGRGRVLCGLRSDELKPQVVRDGATFIVGACSCEAKRQCPGGDLLLAADWSSLLEDQPSEETKLPSLARVNPQPPAEPVPSPTSAQSPAPLETPRAESLLPQSLSERLAAAGMLAVLVVVAGSLAIVRRSSGS